MHRLALMFLFLALPGLALSQARAPADGFVQGPERVGEVRKLSGTVIGIHEGLEETCYVILADRDAKAWAGLGGGGRFFLCGRMTLTLGQGWQGQARQQGTRLARLGPRWRVLPVFSLTRRPSARR